MRECKCGAALDYAPEDVTSCFQCRGKSYENTPLVLASFPTPIGICARCTDLVYSGEMFLTASGTAVCAPCSVVCAAKETLP